MGDDLGDGVDVVGRRRRMKNTIWATAKQFAFALPVALTFSDLGANILCMSAICYRTAHMLWSTCVLRVHAVL